MKLTKTQKNMRKEMLSVLNNAGGMLFSDGSITVAIMEHTKVDGEKGDFVTYGASYCNPCDVYKRKYGEWLALNRFFDAFDSGCGGNQMRMNPGEYIEEFVDRVFFGGIIRDHPTW